MTDPTRGPAAGLDPWDAPGHAVIDGLAVPSWVTRGGYMPEPATPAAREKYRCPATHVVDESTVRCALAPHESDLLHLVRLSGSRRVVRWSDMPEPENAAASVSIQTRCPNMRSHGHGQEIPCPECYSLRVTSERLPTWQPDERWRPCD